MKLTIEVHPGGHVTLAGVTHSTPQSLWNALWADMPPGEYRGQLTNTQRRRAVDANRHLIDEAIAANKITYCKPGPSPTRNETLIATIQRYMAISKREAKQLISHHGQERLLRQIAKDFNLKYPEILAESEGGPIATSKAQKPRLRLKLNLKTKPEPDHEH